MFNISRIVAGAVFGVIGTAIYLNSNKKPKQGKISSETKTHTQPMSVDTPISKTNIKVDDNLEVAENMFSPGGYVDRKAQIAMKKGDFMQESVYVKPQTPQQQAAKDSHRDMAHDAKANKQYIDRKIGERIDIEKKVIAKAADKNDKRPHSRPEEPSFQRQSKGATNSQ